MFEDPHVRHINLVKELNHPITGKIKVVGPPVTYSYATNEVRFPPPRLGEHTFEVLKEFYDNEKLQKLKNDKVIS